MIIVSKIFSSVSYGHKREIKGVGEKRHINMFGILVVHTTIIVYLVVAQRLNFYLVDLIGLNTGFDFCVS